jgi:hypothetical protein
MYPSPGDGYAARGESMAGRSRVAFSRGAAVAGIARDRRFRRLIPTAARARVRLKRSRSCTVSTDAVPPQERFARNRIAVMDLQSVNTATRLFVLTLLAAGRASAAPYSVAAVAADAQAIVLAASDGRLQRLQRGDIVPSGNWRVERIDAGGAVFSRDLPGRAAPLTIVAKRGDTIDFAALDARHGQAPPPRVVLEGGLRAPPARPR